MKSLPCLRPEKRGFVVDVILTPSMLNRGAMTKPTATIPAQPALNDTSLSKVTQPIPPNLYGTAFRTLHRHSSPPKTFDKKEGSLGDIAVARRGSNPPRTIYW
jgi:hypothetical protein